MSVRDKFFEKLLERKDLEYRYRYDALFHKEVQEFTMALDIAYMSMLADNVREKDKIVDVIIHGWFGGR